MKKFIIATVFSTLALFFAGVEVTAQSVVTDIDGNTYQTVVIGTQEWMGENLRVTQYLNGDPLLTNQLPDQWQSSTEGIWAYYDDDQSNDELYGKLYSWYATVDPRGLCPTGWRIPTDNDWQILTEFIDPNAWGNNNSLGTKLKSRRQVNSPLGGEFSTTIHPRWDEHQNRFGTDAFDFGVLPGGAYSPENSFNSKGQRAYYWSSSSVQQDYVWTRVFVYSNSGVSRGQYKKNLGFSIRCIKGEIQTVTVPSVYTIRATNISLNSAATGGDIISDGGAAVTARGVVWSTIPNPTLESNEGQVSIGAGIGNFTCEIEGLQLGTTYWVRAFATNSFGTGYGIQIKLATLTVVGLPSVSTSQVNAITQTSALCGGTITSDGGSPVTTRGVVWNVSLNPTLESNQGLTTDGAGTGNFTSSLTGLSPEVTYYVRAYATNTEGTSYGSNISFTTISDLPVVPDNDHMLLGNPSSATPSVENENDYLMIKPQYCLSYSNANRTSNWASWHLYSGDIGDVERQDDFRQDDSLPPEWYWVTSTAYSGSGFDRGHLCPSADRTLTIPDNSATFLMTNMIPQAPNNNRITWALLEDYSRSIVDEGNELFIVAGPHGQGGTGSNGFATTIGNGIVVPSVTWKVIVVLPDGDQDLSRISASTRVIAVVIPNDQTCSSQSWDYYRVSVDYVESLTGYNFMSNIPSNIQDVIEANIDNVPVAKQSFTPEVDLRIEL